jgi:predicted enzyme related to lactoylglutathione lyase
MTDTVMETAPAAANSNQGQLQGSHIWYELMTTDPDRAKLFYQAIIPGLSVGDRLPGDQDYRIINRSDGGSLGGVLGLSEEMTRHGARPVWMGYIGVDDVDGTVARIEAKGGQALMPAFDIPQGRIAMVADPQGNSFYVMKPVPPQGQEGKDSDVFSATDEQRVSWNELTTADPMAARTFYGELFGWTSDEFMPMGELGEYRFLAHQGTTIGAICQPGPDGSSGWRYYIRVPSISRAVDAVRAGGGTVAMGPHEVPGGDHIIIGQDPQGAEFALVGKQ